MIWSYGGKGKKGGSRSGRWETAYGILGMLVGWGWGADGMLGAGLVRGTRLAGSCSGPCEPCEGFWTLLLQVGEGKPFQGVNRAETRIDSRFRNIILAAVWSRVKKKANWSQTREGLSQSFKQELMVFWGQGGSWGDEEKWEGFSDIKNKFARVWWLTREK